MRKMLQRLGLRALAGLVASCSALFLHPVGVAAQTIPGGCIYEGGSPTTPAINIPAFPECDASRNLKISGTISFSSPQNVNVLSVVNPYNGTTGQTLQSSSFVGIGAVDANGKFSPLQEDTSQNLLAKINAALPAGTNTIGNVNQTKPTAGYTYILDSSGTNLLSVNSSGQAAIQRPYNGAYTQSATSGSFVGIAGWDGTTVDALQTSTTGVLKVQTCTASGNTCGSYATPTNSFFTQAGTVTVSQGMAWQGSNWGFINKDSYATGPVQFTEGGSLTGTVAAGTGTTVIKNSAGRIAGFHITTVGSTGNATCYDNASTGSGTVLLVVPGTSGNTNAFVGFSGTGGPWAPPAANGITCVGASGSPAFTISYY